jgi:hypothetical protein
MIRRLVLAASAVAAIGLTGCNGGSGTTNFNPPPVCGSVTSQLVYPAPGATGVSPAISQVVVAVSSPLQPVGQWNLALTNVATGTGALTLNSLQVITAAQLPAGSASTTISNPTYESAALSSSLYTNFTAGTTIQVSLNYNGDCTPINVPGGTFTLQ